ncbi:hypothetical protein AS157_05740 [Thermosipho sp. 1244]|nr:hypothetical protein [Thermosipho sp. 1244]
MKIMKNNKKNNNKEEGEFVLPIDTLKIFKLNNEKIDNFNLLMNKFIISKKHSKEKKFEKIINNFDFTVFSKLIKKLKKDYYSKIEELSLDLKSFEKEIQWRMIVGLGEPSVCETSMTLHHIYGLPYIPGQALKGMLRNYVILNFFSSEDEALKDKEFCKIFGDKENKGEVLFFDAFPIDRINIKRDVINVHYKEYYDGKSAPCDNLNPKPIFFYTVENTKFKFVIGSKKNMENYEIMGNSLLKLFKKALENHGVGAKTSVGYGYFK